jgi:MFS family permease
MFPGPLGQNPLDAGISLIPFGIGIMVAGFCAGALTDKIGSRNMAFVGPLVAMSGVACLSVMNQNTTTAYVGGILFLSGFGIGLFQSPNSAANMLSVDTHMRGVAAAVNMLTMSFMMMLGIVLTFYFVLHSMTATQLFDLFIYGGAASNSSFPMQAVLNALSKDYYIVIACCISASACAFCLPTNMNDILKQLHAPNTQHSVDGDVEIGKASQEKALDSEDGIEQTFVESKESGLEMNQGFHNKEVLTQ